MTRPLAMLCLFCVLLLASCDSDGDLSPSQPPLPEVTIREVTAPSPEPLPNVAIDVTDREEAADLEGLLTAAGFAIDPAAGTRFSDDAHGEHDTAHLLRPFALVVHPRAPLVDITMEEARVLLAGDIPDRLAAVGLDELAASPEAVAWLDRAHPVAQRSIQELPSDELIDAIASNPRLVGLVAMEELAPRIRVLTIGGHDPYRDPWAEAPLADQRWVSGPYTEAVAHALGWADDTLPDPVGFLATGELIPARCVTARVAQLEAGYDTIFDGTRDLIGAADLAMAHWEPAILDDTPTPCVRTFNLSTVPAAAEATARAGIDVALAVGNHVGDCWAGCSYVTAVRQTVEHLHSAGLLVAGAGENIDEARRPVVVTADGVTFAFLGYDAIAWQHYGARADTPGTAHADLDGLAEDVRAAAALADHVVVGFSWGVEYVAEPTAREREAARTAIEAGASLVVGNHPHWVQATEWIGDGFVAYSLGNFIFDQDWSVETTQGAVLEVGFTRDRILGVRLRPTAIRQQHLVELVDPASAEGLAILDQIWRATDAIAR